MGLWQPQSDFYFFTNQNFYDSITKVIPSAATGAVKSSRVVKPRNSRATGASRKKKKKEQTEHRGSRPGVNPAVPGRLLAAAALSSARRRSVALHLD